MTLLAKNIYDLTELLEYQFKKTDLLERALTHSSARVSNDVIRDNERLEFLGDRVLGLAISDWLMTQYPEAPEGELAKRYNALVRRETCCAVSIELGIGPFLIMSDSERSSGGAQKETILADVCEALLGAIYKDAGFVVAQKFVIDHWSSHLNEDSEVPADPKSSLQEWAQAQRKDLPIYKDLERTGPDHEPEFTTQVIIDGLPPEIGKGSSKRIAEHNAATNMLQREKIWK